MYCSVNGEELKLWSHSFIPSEITHPPNARTSAASVRVAAPGKFPYHHRPSLLPTSWGTVILFFFFNAYR